MNVYVFYVLSPPRVPATDGTILRQCPRIKSPGAEAARTCPPEQTPMDPVIRYVNASDMSGAARAGRK